MKFKAELLLNDCNRAIEMHSDAYQKEEFRLSWFTIVCLLRAIGHVLLKVDRPAAPPGLQKIMDEKWKEVEKNRPDIYWKFILEERNRFIKEYTHTVDRSISFEHQFAGQGPLVTVSINVGQSINSYFGTPQDMKSAIASGVYKGRNEKEVATEALKWWEDYINDIKARFIGTQA